MDDDAIIGLYWNRDESAIVETRSKYGDFCRSLALRLTGSEEDAEECVSDALLSLWNRIPPERPESLRGYLVRTVRNIAVNLWSRNHAQKRGGGMTVLLSELSECVPARQDAWDRLEDRELGRAISKWLRGLSGDDRALFLRRYWYGQELQSLAKEWGVPANRLAQRMRRLRASLRRALEKEDFVI